MQVCVPKPCLTFGPGIADESLEPLAKGIGVRQQGIHTGSLDERLDLCTVDPVLPGK